MKSQEKGIHPAISVPIIIIVTIAGTGFFVSVGGAYGFFMALPILMGTVQIFAHINGTATRSRR